MNNLNIVTMKKMMFLAAILALVAVSSCGNKTKTPGESAKEYARHIQDKNYDKFIEYVYVDAIEPAEVEAKEEPAKKKEANHNVAKHAKVLKEKVEPYVQERGGLKNMNYIAESIAPDGKSAVVTMQNEYNNGQAEDVVYNMILVDDVWKVRVGHDKEVWKTKLADGSHLSFTLKENDHKEVLKENIDGERDFVKEKEGDGKLVEKVREDGHKDVLKIKDKGDEVVVKEKHDGEKNVEKIKK